MACLEDGPEDARPAARRLDRRDQSRLEGKATVQLLRQTESRLATKEAARNGASPRSWQPPPADEQVRDSIQASSRCPMCRTELPQAQGACPVCTVKNVDTSQINLAEIRTHGQRFLVLADVVDTSQAGRQALFDAPVLLALRFSQKLPSVTEILRLRQA